MERRSLPRSGLEVSRIGLGTMTFGEQTGRDEAYAQLDLAHDAGVNLLDTAEMYPVPPREATQGESERLVGRWLRDRGCRDTMVLATKVTARHRGLQHIREGQLPLTPENMRRALEGSLQRLEIDCIDLYQVHWPDRATTNFGQRLYIPDLGDSEETALELTLEALAQFQREGKVRHIGLSNETPWGAMTALKLSETQNWPSVVSIQNPYNLLSRVFDEGLSEIAHREKLPLLAYSPLAFGKLTGKYQRGARPPKSRLSLFPRFDRFNKPAADQAVQAYQKLARELGMTLRELSLRFIVSQPFVASVLLGSSTAQQLEEILKGSWDQLTPEVLDRVNKIHARYPTPCP